MAKKIENRIIKISNIFRTKYLIILILFIGIFNFLGTTVLPEDTFLVSASDIDVYELFILANNERKSRGIKELTIDTRLVAAAEAKGNDMIAKDYWSHYGPNGESPWDFIINAGYDYSYAGENLAKDFSSSSPIHSAWMASPSHRDNIINSSFENIGIAVVTGEFQGKETSIVVQMFGTQQEGYSDINPFIEEGYILPTTGEVEELKPPSITDPKDGEILNEAAFDVKGIKREGSEVRIYDNQNELGNAVLVENEFVYRKTEKYDEGLHSIYAKSFNEDALESDPSNVVNVTVDTIKPNIKTDSLECTYLETGLEGRKYTFSIEIEDNPVSVKGIYEEADIEFMYKDNLWQIQIENDSSLFSQLSIQAVDPAGNIDEAVISGEELNSISENVQNQGNITTKVNKWIVDNLLTRIFTRSLRGRVNFLVAFLMVILLSIEQIVLSRTGYTNQKSNPLINLTVFSILLFSSLIGSGGEIL